MKPEPTAGEPVAVAELRRQAESALATCAAAKPPTDSVEVERLLHELRARQIELEMQNEELRRTQAELEASRERYVDLYDLAPVGYVTVGETGLILEANLTAAMLLGVDRRSLTEQPLSRFILPADQDVHYLHCKHRHETGSPQSCELRLMKQDGTAFWAHMETLVVPDAGDVPVWRIAFNDIAERKQAEAALRESEELHRGILRTAMNGFWLVDPQGRLLEVNQAYCRMSGYSEPELLAMRVPELEAIETAGDVAAHIQKVITEGEDHFESRHLRKDGTLYDVAVNVQFQPGAGGRLVAFLRDISGRKRAEAVMRARLRLSEFALRHTLAELLRRTVDEAEALTGSSVGFFHFVGADQRTVWLQTWSSNTLERACMATGEGQHYPVDRAGVWADALRERRPVIHNDYASLPQRQGLPPGHAPVLRELVVPMLRDDQVVALLGVGNKPREYGQDDIDGVSQLANLAWDIVETKRADEALRASEERHRMVADFTYDWEYWRLPDGRLTYVSPSCERISGYPASAFIQDPDLLTRIVHPDDRQRISGHLHDGHALTASHCPLAPEFRILTHAGEERWIGHACQPVFDRAGTYLGRRASNRDITDRKQAEAVLARSLETMRAFLNAIPESAFLMEVSGKLLTANEVTARRLGKTLPELLGANAYSLLPLEVAADRRDRVEEVSRSRQGAVFEDVRSGRIIESHVHPVLEGQSPVTAVAVMAVDVTERRRAEDSLRWKEVETLAILESTVDGILAADCQGRVIKANRRFAEMWGIPRPLLESHDDQALLAFVVQRLAEPDAFLRKVEALYGSDAIDEDTVAFKDGRVFERRSAPLMLDGAVAGRVWSFHDVTASRRAAEDLLASEARFRAIFERSTVGASLTSPAGKLLRVNPAFAAMLGRPVEDLQKEDFAVITHPDDVAVSRKCIRSLLAQELTSYRMEKRYRHQDGHYVWADVSTTLLRDRHAEPLYFITSIVDISERKRSEAERLKLSERLAEAQRMESVGRLAGGVAHEFNNKLMGIMNYAELSRDELPPGHPVRCYLDEITTEAQRSADTARQLLAFARKQVIAPRLLNLNDALADALTMVRHVLGADIEVARVSGADLWPVTMDPGQFDQILASLAANARDAIAGVGRFVIETRNCVLDPAYCAEHQDAAPGDHVMLAVSDTGRGMNQEVLGHLFEPFFTTKGMAEGTGMGLATIYGIVRQNHGSISVTSVPGEGTTFCIHLPRAAEAAAAAPVGSPVAALPHGVETILLADDEKSIRATAARFLAALGYTVLTAAEPEEALRLAAEQPGEIDLLITDVVMPGMSGADLARRLGESRPGLRCLFMSGYTADAVAQRGVQGQDAHFLAKPFSRDDLARKVREVLDGGGAAMPSL